jgi:rubrerythrin
MNPTHPPEAIKTIEKLLQDNLNAYVFYKYVTGIAPNGEARDILSSFTEECVNNKNQYDTLLERFYAHSFTPSERETDAGLSYAKALELAVLEENKAINTLADLINTFHDPEAERILQRIINKKIAGYNHLTMLKGT